jgi:HNH endonuclease
MRDEHDRFLAKVEIGSTDDDCWLWQGATYRTGYGHFRRKIDGKWKMYKTHRYSYEYYNGEIPEGLGVLHKCDVTNCVNPKHLFIGTNGDNNRDTHAKGRARLGRNPKHQHLSQAHADNYRLVWEAYKHEMTQRQLAKCIGISPQQLNRILNNQIWRNPKFAA